MSNPQQTHVHLTAPDWFLEYCEGMTSAGKQEARRIELALGIPEGTSAFACRMKQVEDTLKNLKPIETPQP